MFSVTIAVSSLWQDLSAIARTGRESGRGMPSLLGGGHPIPRQGPFTTARPPAVGFQSQTPVVLLSLLLPNRKVNKQLTFPNALLLGYFFLRSPDVLKCVAPDASSPTG